MSEYAPLADPAQLAAATSPAYAAATAEGLEGLLKPHLRACRGTRILRVLRGPSDLAFILSSRLVPDEVRTIREALRKGGYEEGYAYRDDGEYPRTVAHPAWVFGPEDLRTAGAIPWHLRAAAAAAVLTVTCAAVAYVTHATRYV